MAAHQCPRCELKFSYRTEVEWHLAHDHRPVQRKAATDDANDPAVDAVAAVAVPAATAPPP